MSQNSKFLPWVATTIAVVGVVVCATLPWYYILIETDSEKATQSIYLWTTDSTIRPRVSAWACAIFFLLSAFATRWFASRPKVNGIILAIAATAIIIAALYNLLGRTGGINLPGLRITKGWAPIISAIVAIALVFVAIEMMRPRVATDNIRVHKD